MGKSKAPKTPDYTGAAREEARGNLDLAKWSTNTNRPNQTTPYGSQTWALRPGADPNNPQPGDWQLSTTLSGGQQELLDQDTALKKMLGGLATGVGASSSLGTAFDASGLGSAPDYSKLNTYTTDLAGARQNASDAVYNELTKRYDDRFTRDEDALRTRLVNQGLQEGSEAWNSAYKDFQNTKSDAYGSAANQAQIAGREEMSSNLENLVRALTSQQTGYSQGLSDLIRERSAPIDEINSLRQATGPTMPSFSGFNTTSTPQGADLTGALANTYQSQLAKTNAENAQQQQLFSTLGGLASMALFGASDRRLKSDIRRVGTHKLGIGVYEYKIYGEPSRGVMAQELQEIMPEAVVEMPSGYLAVNYGMIGGV